VRAAILSIGDELTTGQMPEGNASWLAARLAAMAVTTVELRVVPDDRAAIAGAIRDMAARCDLLLATGGIGPTADDLTRHALGDVLAPGRPLETDAEVLAELESRWRRRAGTMPPANAVQARYPRGTRLVPNPRGTAPGIAGELDGCRIFVMPGPPHEMRTMFRDHVLPALSNSAGAVRLIGRVHEFGLGESAAEQRLGTITDRSRRPRVGITHADAVVTARIQAQGSAEDAARQLHDTRRQILDAWRPYAYGTDDETLADATVSLLREQGRTLSTAESCTGGWLGKLIVDVPGSSACYVGGWVTYSDALKTSCLAVEAEIIREHGAVSDRTARAMAAGALSASGADESLAVTGIAGPDGAMAGKPVGTVFIGLARRAGDGIDLSVRRFLFPGDRTTVRDRASKSALQMLRFALLGVQPHEALLWEVAVEAYIGLGSNLGDRRALIETAVLELGRLDGVEVIAVSRLIETEPVGPSPQPGYLNGAVAIRTTLAPRRLLEAMHAIEASHGRDRANEPRWGPRRLDLDLLLYGEETIDEPGLTVPHPHMHERIFVLEPLSLIAPGVLHPALRVSIQCLRDRVASQEPEYGAETAC